MSEKDIKEQEEQKEPAAAAETVEDQKTERPEQAVQQEENGLLKDQLLRKIAEFENFKRRTREEKDALMKYGAEPVLRDLLPVLDDFERSLTSGREHPDFDSLYKGIEIIYAKLLRTLEQRGLKSMDVIGTPFDVDFHDALLQIPNSEVEAGTVLDQAEKGYMLYDKVIRHAKVTVAKEVDDVNTEQDS